MVGIRLNTTQQTTLVDKEYEHETFNFRAGGICNTRRLQQHAHQGTGRRGR
jgi:hypothetical protein